MSVVETKKRLKYINTYLYILHIKIDKTKEDELLYNNLLEEKYKLERDIK